MDTSVIVALVSVVGNIVIALISYSANKKGAKEASTENAKLIAFRIQQLEQKQDKHNSVIERMYKLEAEMNEVQRDIDGFKARNQV